MTINGDFGSLTKDQKHYLTRGLENVTRMTKVIDDLLNVTKIEEQRFAYNFKKNDINKLTKDALDNFEGELKKKKLTLKTNFGKITAFPFDYEKMHMAISNLIDNSIKYTAKGNIEITTSQKKAKYYLLLVTQVLVFLKSSKAKYLLNFSEEQIFYKSIKTVLD